MTKATRTKKLINEELAVVIKKLDDAAASLESTEEELKASREKLKRLEHKLKQKESELAEQDAEIQLNVEDLERELRKLDKSAEELIIATREEAFKEIVDAVKDELDEVQSQIDEHTNNYHVYSDKIPELRSYKSAIQELDPIKKEIEFLKLANDLYLSIESGPSEDLRERFTRLSATNKSRIQGVIESLNSTPETSIDDLISIENDKMKKVYSNHDLTEKDLEEFIDKIPLEKNLNLATRLEFIETLVKFAKSQKTEELDKITALEPRRNELEDELSVLEEQGVDGLRLPKEIKTTLQKRINQVNKERSELRRKMYSQEALGENISEEFARQLTTIRDDINKEQQLIKEKIAARDSLDSQIYTLDQERSALEKESRKRTPKKEVSKAIPEVYVSDSPHYQRIKRDIRHRKELATAKAEEQQRAAAFSAELQSDLLRLQKEDERLRAANAELLEQLKFAREQLESVRKEPIEITEHIPSLAEELAEAEERESSSADQSVEIEKLRSELESVREASETARAELVAKHAEQTTVLEAQLSAAKAENAEKQSALESAQASLRDAQASLASTQEAQAALTSQLATAKSSLEAGDGDKAALAEKITALEAQLAASRKEQQAKETALAAAKEESLAAQSASETARAELVAKHAEQTTVLEAQLTSAKAENAEKQSALESAQAELASAKAQQTKLKTQLAITKAQVKTGIESKTVSDETIAVLQARISQNKQQQKDKTDELSRAKKQLKTSQSALDEAEKTYTFSMEDSEDLEPKSHSKKPTSTKTAIPDRISTVSDDEILREFREIQCGLITGSEEIHDIPENVEEFHHYASQHGEEIDAKLKRNTLNSIRSAEQKKYKSIHEKYPHKDIEWGAENTATIESNGVEICNLNSKIIKTTPTEYTLSGQKIKNYRNVDVPLKSKSGSMHISLAVKDLSGRNISEKDAVYFTAHYDKQGKLVEMTMPIPVHFTGKGKNSPVCIKKNGKIYTLPINRGKYEEMQKTIAKNKGLDLNLTKESVAKDSFSVGEKADVTTKDLAASTATTKLQSYKSTKKASPVRRKQIRNKPSQLR